MQTQSLEINPQHYHDSHEIIDLRSVETLAEGKVACLACGRPATRWIRSTSQHFSAPRCYLDAIALSKYFASIDVTDVQIEMLGARVGPGVDRPSDPPMIAGVDLVQLAREILDGVVGEYDALTVLASRAGLVAAMRDQIDQRARCELSAFDEAEIDLAASMARTMIRESNRAQLAEHAARVHRVRGIA